MSFSVIRTLKLEAVTTLPRNRSLEQKVISALFIVFENFFKITLVYACLLLWNTNDISRISINNFITYPKHSQIHFLTGTLMSIYVYVTGQCVHKPSSVASEQSQENVQKKSKNPWTHLNPRFWFIMAVLIFWSLLTREIPWIEFW